MTTAEKAHEKNWVPADTLAARVVVLRTALGLTRREFSQLTGITENALQGIEGGRSPHKLAEKIQAIHQATGASRDWLMWGGQLTPVGVSGTVLTHE
ncbi:helix-turn-helix family protein [Mycobacteroides abscessus 5S-0422]|uniref:Helix-turn-helix family protein n=1 Tax=Mycobacteroides abscessus subsp. bolletii 1513 TaxID=1299321 RepID=X8DJK3_9MYCO|nr:helix-turn-helix transcriptional regulator [Mycobacteroides abscessus]EUA67913.1 helix-turn-helix family protein [Mycobacteroides abscessus subsp. bolletii 1513]EIU05236.1 helix-turn-helix family protein [Mycobacteroides abscessus 5S-0422]EIU07735.1 helix-turn-helix family protein [Mycobacteroides abscessus 5S-0421]EIU10084.1 helix-turn-helix family protein [Mycobacteroides abscessus 5S-0304]EIU22538.1 helix-turn-helix family protein [Mycobacteroides abscessus 5S-0708]